MDVKLSGQMEHYMNLLAARQKLVASNIANAETPGYHAKDIDFQFEFHSLASGADAPQQHQPHAIEAPGLRERNDGNNVSMDREMRLLSENALRFQFVSQLMKNHFQQYRRALQGGR
jgi:flagellar basal-body rod protein FlgB